MQIPEYILSLIEKYQAGRATPEEKLRLNEWYHSFNDTEAEITTSDGLTELQLAERIKKQVFETIRTKHKPEVTLPRRKWRIPAAAAILLLIATGAFFIFNTKGDKHKVANAKPQPAYDIAPGGNKAVLILADGSSIILDSASNGTISQQGNIKIEKMDNGLLAYLINGKQVTENDKAFYNTISTPRGGQYQVTLSDGTKVWLNAASSIRFPVFFTGTERKVEITGEAYFEVSKNKGMPFKVKAATSEIEVLGTHFNVNAYDDEASIKTTLLEGLVKVSVPAGASNQSARFIKPGQQADINKEGKINILNNADTEEAVAWINGRFQFKSADLQSILRQISRWYDVDIEYKGNANLHFTGQLPRSISVSKVFEKLEMTGEVHLKIDGKKIIVSPK
ncbi:MAG: FecR domain-containing protein [Sphingobacteriales bacterium]|nr:FecR domain-containing protein [Sphingobacteriales bacterium]